MILKKIKQLSISIFCCVYLVSCDKPPEALPDVDVVLIGGGIMSATLGVLLHELDPNLSIALFEKLDAVALESSAADNNAGTGHAAFAELNYTPENSDGTINIQKAIEIAESFEISKQFWAYQVSSNGLPSPEHFIQNVPHMSFVWGEESRRFLKNRHSSLIKNPLFFGMEYSEDPNTILGWAPLLMEGRPQNQKLAATYMKLGTDVNFGSLTRGLIGKLLKLPTFSLSLKSQVKEIQKKTDGSWDLIIEELTPEKKRKILNAKFIFIGAGGGSLTLLQKSKIPESKIYAGFPVGGSWLVSHKKALIEKHNAKVYGKAAVGAPPMSVPHLDSRFIDGKEALLFGPFATYSTKFLKQGSSLDLFQSITLDNVIPMLSVGFHNFGLIRYLIEQVMMSASDRLAALREYVPDAKLEDWHLEIAGQRVQVIKKSPDNAATLQFGTELVVAQDRSLAGLLGASPGASTSVEIMLGLLKRAFPQQMESQQWQKQLKKMIPSYGLKLGDNPELLKNIREENRRILGLSY